MISTEVQQRTMSCNGWDARVTSASSAMIAGGSLGGFGRIWWVGGVLVWGDGRVEITRGVLVWVEMDARDDARDTKLGQ